MNNILTVGEQVLIKKSGSILREAMKKVADNVKVGVSAKYLDEIAENEIIRMGAVPSFKNYYVEGAGSFPASTCVSINDEVVHGLPTEEKIIKDGDIVSIDLGAEYQGMCTDMAITIAVGKVNELQKKLIEVTAESLLKGIDQARTGNRIGSIGHAVQTYAESYGFGVVRDLVGHGIGKKAHMEPQIPNFGSIDDGPVIEEGMALAIEPMITLGSPKIKQSDDGWTIRTKDGQPAAHFEHTVVIINGKPEVVTG